MYKKTDMMVGEASFGKPAPCCIWKMLQIPIWLRIRRETMDLKRDLFNCKHVSDMCIIRNCSDRAKTHMQGQLGYGESEKIN